MFQTMYKSRDCCRLKLICGLFAILSFMVASTNKPHASRAAHQQCPSVRIDGCPGAGVTSGTTVTLTAVIENAPQNFSPTYTWTFKDSKRDRSGRLSPLDDQGQCGTGTPNTERVCIDTSGLRGAHTAMVSIGGWPAGCTTSNTATCTFDIVDQPVAIMVEQYGNVAFDDEKARLDNYAIQLQNEPGSQGYIIAYAGRRSRAGEAQARADRAKDYLVNTYGIDPERIVTVDGGYREVLTVELWIVPQGATPPTPTPTVQASEVETPPTPSKKRRGKRRP